MALDRQGCFRKICWFFVGLVARRNEILRSSLCVEPESQFAQICKSRNEFIVPKTCRQFCQLVQCSRWSFRTESLATANWHWHGHDNDLYVGWTARNLVQIAKRSHCQRFRRHDKIFKCLFESDSSGLQYRVWSFHWDTRIASHHYRAESIRDCEWSVATNSKSCVWSSIRIADYGLFGIYSERHWPCGSSLAGNVGRQLVGPESYFTHHGTNFPRRVAPHSTTSLIAQFVRCHFNFGCGLWRSWYARHSSSARPRKSLDSIGPRSSVGSCHPLQFAHELADASAKCQNFQVDSGKDACTKSQRRIRCCRNYGR